METYVCTKNGIWICVLVLSGVASDWKQTKCLSPGKWINKLWIIHAVEYYSAMKNLIIGTYNYMDQSRTNFRKDILYDYI